MRRVTVGHGRGERVDEHLLIRRWLDQTPRRAATGTRLANARTHVSRATFKLERWYFVLRGESENPHPFVGVYNGKPFVLAFTNGKRVRDSAVANGYAADDDNAFSITMTPVMGWCGAGDWFGGDRGWCR
jgi:hypothetical protein